MLKRLTAPALVPAFLIGTLALVVGTPVRAQQGLEAVPVQLRGLEAVPIRRPDPVKPKPPPPPPPTTGLEIAPFFGYAMGTAVAVEGGTETLANLSGYGFGARLGYQFRRWYLGADLHLSPLTSTSVRATDTAMITQVQVAPVLGLRFGGKFTRLRTWLGLGFINDFTDKFDDSYSGFGWKLGLGYRLFRGLGLKVEYQLNPISQFCPASGECQDLTEGTSVSENVLFFSMSLPITLWDTTARGEKP